MTMPAKTDPPKILYKYFPPERVNFIQTQEIRFSPPSEFNDTFDTFHSVPRKARGILDRLSLRRDLGVFCLTERSDNHIMWVNYAQSHTGFVIGFDTTTGFFEDDERSLRKVAYPPQPPTLLEPEENGCFYKSPDWEYEEEWRSVRRFQGNEGRLVPVDWQLIKQIIFGYKMAPWMISEMVSMVTLFGEQYGTGPECLHSAPSQSDWRFINEHKNYRSCEHCNGKGYTSSAVIKEPS